MGVTGQHMPQTSAPPKWSNSANQQTDKPMMGGASQMSVANQMSASAKMGGANQMNQMNPHMQKVRGKSVCTVSIVPPWAWIVFHFQH